MRFLVLRWVLSTTQRKHCEYTNTTLLVHGEDDALLRNRFFQPVQGPMNNKSFVERVFRSFDIQSVALGLRKEEKFRYPRISLRTPSNNSFNRSFFHWYAKNFARSLILNRFSRGNCVNIENIIVRGSLKLCSSQKSCTRKYFNLYIDSMELYHRSVGNMFTILICIKVNMLY